MACGRNGVITTGRSAVSAVPGAASRPSCRFVPCSPRPSSSGPWGTPGLPRRSPTSASLPSGCVPAALRRLQDCTRASHWPVSFTRVHFTSKWACPVSFTSASKRVCRHVKSVAGGENRFKPRNSYWGGKLTPSQRLTLSVGGMLAFTKSWSDSWKCVNIGSSEPWQIERAWQCSPLPTFAGFPPVANQTPRWMSSIGQKSNLTFLDFMCLTMSKDVLMSGIWLFNLKRHTNLTDWCDVLLLFRLQFHDTSQGNLNEIRIKTVA